MVPHYTPFQHSVYQKLSMVTISPRVSQNDQATQNLATARYAADRSYIIGHYIASFTVATGHRPYEASVFIYEGD